MKQPTIRDVAQRAGVSAASVSRHLNKTLALPMAMAVRIDAAILALGYRPNVMARRLSRGTSETIGFVTADIAAPFFAAIASAVEEEAERHGYSVMICNTRNQVAREVEYLAKLRDGHVDGLIFLTNHRDDGTLRDVIARTDNVVLVDEDVPGTGVPKFFVDNFAGGYAATRHLIECGHRRIAHISGPPGMISVDERLRGFQAALAEAGIPYDESLVRCGSYDAAFGATAFHDIWASSAPPTAVFATADLLALAIYQAARELALRVPEDVSVVGFDDLPFVGFLDPPLTTVRQPADELGRLAVQALLARGTLPAIPQILPVELVKRRSVVRLPASADFETTSLQEAR